jgi:3-methyladenine DNA glycosylase AlkD
VITVTAPSGTSPGRAR